MATKREPVQIVEIDIDFCTLTYGTGSCDADLGDTGVRKCYNSWNTCQVKDVYNKGSLTLRFINDRANLPVGGPLYFPTLKSVSAFSSSVNIAGSNPKLGELGKRGKVTVELMDFPYHDRATDKYANERVSGDAQVDEGGYNPENRGTFWTKFKKRHPNYGNRPLRVKNGYLEPDGTIFVEQTRNFIITDIVGPNDSNRVTIEAKDILTLAEKKTSVAPKASRGEISREIGETGLPTVRLNPSGVGSEYPSEGFAVIGSEIVRYTRSGDNVSIRQRAAKGSERASHAIGDTFQVALNYEEQRIDQVVDDLLRNYTSIPNSFIPTSDYTVEVIRWASTTLINTIITKPTPVAELLGELSVLGASIWWDDVTQEVKLRMNHPLDINEVPYKFSDDNAIKQISQKDRDEERLTQIHFYSVQSDPTQDREDKENYDRVRVYIDTDAQREENYGETRIREIFCRWFNTGNEASVRIISRRLLQRFTKAPTYTSITLDAKDIGVGLTDVLEVTSRVVSDETGASVPTLLQVTEKTEVKSGHEVKVVAQAYNFNDAYGYIMENDANNYGSATTTEKERGCYIIDEGDEQFSDGREFYRII